MWSVRGGGTVLGVLLLVMTTGGCGSNIGGDRSGKDSTPAASKPSDVVKGYLHALASGDAHKALGYLAKRPSDRMFLTDKVLKKANDLAPLTDISVPAASGSSGDVKASYKLGSKQVTTKFWVRSDSSTQPRIDKGAFTTDIDDRATDVTKSLNGAKLTTEDVELFPVAYKITSATKYIDFGSTAHFVVKPQDTDAFHTLKPELTSRGQRAFRKAVSASVTTCLASKKLDAGCGLKLSEGTLDGYTLKQGTVARSRNAGTKAALTSLKGELVDTDGTTAEDHHFRKAKPDVRADVSRNGHTDKQVKLDTTGSFGNPTVTITKKKPKVTWE